MLGKKQENIVKNLVIWEVVKEVEINVGLKGFDIIFLFCYVV